MAWEYSHLISAGDFLGPLDGSLPRLYNAGNPFSFESICINVEEGLGSWGAGSLRKVGVGRAFQGPMDKRPNCVGKCSLSLEQNGSLSQET